MMSLIKSYGRKNTRQVAICRYSALGLIGSAKTKDANRIIARFVTKAQSRRLPLAHYCVK